MENFLERSKEGIYTIIDKKFKELQVIWENRRDDDEIPFILAKEITTTGGKKSQFSSIVLIGRNLDKKYVCVHEGLLGRLTAIDIGLVFFNPIMKSDGIGGLLYRDPWGTDFSLRSLKKTYFQGHFYIRKNNDIKSEAKYPYIMTYNPGHDHFISFGVTSSRWKEMEEWLNKWLPKSE